MASRHICCHVCNAFMKLSILSLFLTNLLQIFLISKLKMNIIFVTYHIHFVFVLKIINYMDKYSKNYKHELIVWAYCLCLYPLFLKKTWIMTIFLTKQGKKYKILDLWRHLRVLNWLLFDFAYSELETFHV